MINSISPTMTKMTVLEIVMARRKLQSTLLKLRFARETKIKTGKENFPTNKLSNLLFRNDLVEPSQLTKNYCEENV